MSAPSVITDFDPDWYLSHYPDVAEAGVEPLRHYLEHGRYEGRLPCELEAARLEDALWFEGSDQALERLDGLAAAEDSPLETAYAAWALARWYGSFDNWPAVLRYMDRFRALGLADAVVSHPGPVLLELMALRDSGDSGAAGRRLEAELRSRGEIPDLLLAAASLAEPRNRLDAINRLYRNAGLAPVGWVDPEREPGMDNLGLEDTAGDPSLLGSVFTTVRQRLARVSIIVPAWNAEDTLPTVLRSLQQQSWRNLEIIVVDDASGDDTYGVARSFAAGDARIRVYRQDTNRGVYAARNAGLARARGKYITVHDSDDWSHPQKIEQQVRVLAGNRRLAACLSHWVRCTPDLMFRHWRINISWIYRNTSSLMFRRSVCNRIGYWDRVKAGGDTEYYHRILKVYGNDAVADVLPGIPLAFGRHSSDSLSQHSTTHLRTQFKGVRRDYLDAARVWHDEAAARGELYLPAEPERRPFPAPAEIEILNDTELLQRSGLFDPEWYQRTYPDVAEAGVDPLQHYLMHGGFEGRDPGPNFSSSGYAYACGDADPAEVNPLVHYLRKGRERGHAPLPELPGARPRRTGAATILVCAHSSGARFFGAERSLLDIVSALDGLGYNVMVTVPAVGNDAYMDKLCNRTMAVVVMPYRWWSGEREPGAETRANFLEVMRQYDVRAVHANTIVLWEPLLAAREYGIPALVHARELLEHDPELCDLLKSDPETIRRHVPALADHLIANSVRVAEYFAVPEKTTVVPNTTDMEELDMENPAGGAGPIRVAMISCNAPKKGLDDFVGMASLLRDRAPGAECILVGPENDHTQALLDGQRQGRVPDNMVVAGYADSPREALAQGHIIVNLSHCQESFGRTVLEAMAARRPVVAYDWGGLSELVEDGVSGFLVPYRDVDAVVEKVAGLIAEPERIIAMGEAGRQRALERYGNEVFVRKLESVYSKVLGAEATLNP